MDDTGTGRIQREWCSMNMNMPEDAFNKTILGHLPFLTITNSNRIFVLLKASDCIKDALKDHDFL